MPSPLRRDYLQIVLSLADLNVLTQQPFGLYEVEITGELGAYCDDDQQLDIYSEWQITVEYESDIIINNGDQNLPPIAVAGDDITVDYGASVTLDGTGSYDFDGSINQYYWTQESGIPVFFGEPEAPTIGFVAPNEFSVIVFLVK